MREEDSALHARLGELEEAKLRTERALCTRDAQLYEMERASHAAAQVTSQALGGEVSSCC